MKPSATQHSLQPVQPKTLPSQHQKLLLQQQSLLTMFLMLKNSHSAQPVWLSIQQQLSNQLMSLRVMPIRKPRQPVLRSRNSRHHLPRSWKNSHQCKNQKLWNRLSLR